MTVDRNRQSDSSRVLLVSQRGLSDQVANSALYEFEDLLCNLDGVDVFTSSQSSLLPGKLYKAARRLGASRQFARTMTLRPTESVPDRHYDLMFAVFDHYRQVSGAHTLAKWRERCDRAICFVAEIWPKDLRSNNAILELFDVFDYVFVGVNHCADQLTKMVGKPCINLHPAVDTERLATYPDSPRSIDVSYIGRRSPITHQALIDLADKEDRFYYFDTLKGLLRTANHSEHRRLFADILKRSRYFIANYGKIDRPDQTGGAQEVGYRFFEGAAAGTVMIGRPPAGDAFRRLFPWQDAVIEAPFDAPDIADLIHDLEADPERIKRIRAANVVNALKMHDWLYRYETILTTVGMEKTPAMAERRERLETLADRVQQRSQPEGPTDRGTSRRSGGPHLEIAYPR